MMQPIFSSVISTITIILVFDVGIFLSNCNAQNVTNNKVAHPEEEVDPLELWEAPLYIAKNYPYYLAGHDDEKRPIWIMEAGKWDIRRIVEEYGEAGMQNMEKYSQQQIYRVAKSIKESSTPDNPVSTWVFICDAEGYDLQQLSSIRTVTFVLKLARNIEILTRNMEYGYLVNLNFFVESLVNILRPILGSALARAEIFGTNREKWIPNLLKKLPKDQLPEYYGGYKNFTPVAVYG